MAGGGAAACRRERRTARPRQARARSGVVVDFGAGDRQFGRRLRCATCWSTPARATASQRGQAAMTGDGLVGRVAEVGQRTARILLLTDLNSHIPVMIEGTQRARRARWRQFGRAPARLSPAEDRGARRRPNRQQRQRRSLPAGHAGRRRRLGRGRNRARRALCRTVAARDRPHRRLRPVRIAAAERRAAAASGQGGKARSAEAAQ